jgi:hypothetical protein
VRQAVEVLQAHDRCFVARKCVDCTPHARSDGKPQVIYNGHPLYTYSGDNKAGNTNGQGVNAFGGLWYVLSPKGNEITSTPSTSGGSGGSSGSPGY